ncbi:DNA pilot protein [robinz microvirus RP_93]|nr:DNA pilot protein [robinz microvirus RP_93]
MFPLIAAGIGAAGSLIGNIFSSNTARDNTNANIAMQAQTNQLSAAESQRNREFQSSELVKQRDYESLMSNSAYQRSSADMQAAGLNPSMMFGSGGPASTPSTGSASGSQASFGTARSENRSALQDLGHAVNNGVSNAINVKTFEKMSDEIALLRANEARQKAEELYTGQKTETEKAETLKRHVEASIRQFELPAHRVKAKEAEAIEKMPGWLINSLSQMKYGSDKTSGVTDQIGSFISSALGAKKFVKGTGSQTQESGTDSKGQWYDRFRDSKSW